MIHTLLNISFRSAVIYTLVVLGIRLTGKREVGQMTPLDLVLLLLIANAVQNAMTGPDTTISGGLVAAATLLLLNAIVTRITWRFKNVRGVVEGSPTLLIHNGQCVEKNLAREKISREDIDQALREHGVASLEEVSSAVLEVDGAISVLRKDELPQVARPHHRVRFIRRG